MASIKKRNNSFLITVSMGKDSTGKQILKYSTYRPIEIKPKAIEKEVQHYAYEFEQRVKFGRYVNNKSITFHDFVKIWTVQWAKFNLRPHTLEEYVYLINLRIMKDIGGLKISAIKTVHIQACVNKMADAGLAEKTILKSFTAINSVFKYAVKIMVIRENPCLDCEIPKLRKCKKINFFTPDQVKCFLQWIQKNESIKWQAFFTLAVHGGFRRGEIIALDWGDIDFDKKIISISKSAYGSGANTSIKDTKTEAGLRKVVLPKHCFDILEVLWGEQHENNTAKENKESKSAGNLNTGNEAIFTNEHFTGRMNVQLPTHKFKQIIRNINKEMSSMDSPPLPEIRLHDLRHTNASLLISEGVDVETVAYRLGHAKASITLDIYGHALPEKNILAANIMEKLLS